MRQLRALAAGVRDQIRLRYAERLLVDGFEPMGCDGSRIECPRTAELEARLRAGRQGELGPDRLGDRVRAPGDRAVVVVATGTGDRGRAGPSAALAGDALARGPDRRRRGLHGLRAGPGHRADAGGRSCCGCRRRSISTPLERAELETWSEGPVYYWPACVQKKGHAADRVPPDPRAGHAARPSSDVWLLTDILDPARLSVATAAEVLPLEMAK